MQLLAPLNHFPEKDEGKKKIGCFHFDGYVDLGEICNNCLYKFVDIAEVSVKNGFYCGGIIAFDTLHLRRSTCILPSG